MLHANDLISTTSTNNVVLYRSIKIYSIIKTILFYLNIIQYNVNKTQFHLECDLMLRSLREKYSMSKSKVVLRPALLIKHY